MADGEVEPGRRTDTDDATTFHNSEESTPAGEGGLTYQALSG